jgi:hypothetical protein
VICLVLARDVPVPYGVLNVFFFVGVNHIQSHVHQMVRIQVDSIVAVFTDLNGFDRMHTGLNDSRMVPATKLYEIAYYIIVAAVDLQLACPIDADRLQTTCNTLAAAMLTALPLQPKLEAGTNLSAVELAIVAAVWKGWASTSAGSAGDKGDNGSSAGASGAGKPHLSRSLLDATKWVLPLDTHGLMAAVRTKVRPAAAGQRVAILTAAATSSSPRSNLGGGSGSDRYSEVRQAKIRSQPVDTCDDCDSRFSATSLC